MPIVSERLTFMGSQGHDLAARLDRPDGPVRAYALFAHCFTCSKDVFAAARIASGLAERGIGVLRFDFTGLGASGGDFGNTNFSSNVEDLVLAADHLRTNYRAPAILIGHSLGGAAVIVAASHVREARAVVTIGAPSDTEHVQAHFAAHLDTIADAGEAEATIAGRTFTIRKQFLDDLKSQKVVEAAAALKRPFLILHGPLDATVGIDHAGKLFVAAKHPKSFISLDTADHLLTDKRDAAYAAGLIAGWAERYLEPADAAPEVRVPAMPLEEGGVLVAESGDGTFVSRMRAGAHTIVGDQPAASGGLDAGPAPYDLLMMSLGLCTVQTLRMYADRKGLEIGRTQVRLTFDKIHASDCADCLREGQSPDAKIGFFRREIRFGAELSAETRARLLAIADKCPVHQILRAVNKIETREA